LQQGKRHPKASCDVRYSQLQGFGPSLLLSEDGPGLRAASIGRIKYEQTIGDIKQAVEKKLGIPVDKQQLFWHNKELTKVTA